VESNPLEIAKRLCILFEGVYLKPYLCPAGIPTIGVGSTFYEKGTRVTLADPPITRERAEQLLLWELEKNCLPRVLRMCPNIKDWGPEAIAAIVDFVYNLGSGQLQSSTLRKRILADDKEGAKEELMKWVKGGGKVLPGLVKRRTVECSLIN
jgi:lysozyme